MSVDELAGNRRDDWLPTPGSSRGRWLRRSLGLGAALVALAWIVSLPAGPDSYYQALATGFTENGVPLLGQQPRHDLLAEGDRACAWLARQPVAPAVAPGARNTGDDPYGAPTMYWRYIAETKDAPLVHVDDGARVVIPMEAWIHLCPGFGNRLHPLDGDD